MTPTHVHTADDAPGFPDVLTGETGLDDDGAPICAECGEPMEIYCDAEGEEAYCPTCWAYTIAFPVRDGRTPAA